MHKIHCLNSISPAGRALFGDGYEQTEKLNNAQGALVRSADMHGLPLPDGLLAVARAGAGVNNIPLDVCAEAGVVVFNTPGANAGGVAELALCGMLLSCREIVGGIEWVQSVRAQVDVAARVEKEKSRFAGVELSRRTLGIIGLGAVGGALANMAKRLGMTVYGYDPYLSVEAAWHLDAGVIRLGSSQAIFEKCDFISLHLPLTDDTRGLIGADAFAQMKPGAVLLNFARGGLVDDDALESVLREGRLHRYVTDFPNDKTAGMAGVIAIPHLGASTEEAEENCARMAVRQMMNYLENGNITNSVNFPACDMGVCTSAGRIAILHRNIPNSLGQFTSAVAGENINIAGLRNASRGEYAYTLLDLDQAAPEAVVSDLQKITGVLRVRVVK